MSEIIIIRDIWFKPRKTMRYIIGKDNKSNVLSFIILLSFLLAVYSIVFFSITSIYEFLEIVFQRYIL